MSSLKKNSAIIAGVVTGVFGVAAISATVTYIFVTQQVKIEKLQTQLETPDTPIVEHRSVGETPVQAKEIDVSKDALLAQTPALFDEQNLSLVERFKIAHQDTPAPPPEIHPAMMEDNAPIIADTMFYGSEDARFIIEAYSDVECPFCRKSHFAIKQVVNYKPDLVGLEYKHFPLASHNPASAIQGAIIECTFAEKGNQYAWLMLDEMVKHTKGAGRGQGDYAAFAEHLRVSPEWLEACVANETYQQNVMTDYQEGLSLGIKATPTYFITDRKTGKRKMVEGSQSAESMAKALFEFAGQRQF